MRCWCALAQCEKSVVVIVTGEILQGAGFENLDLLLSICELSLTEFEQFGATLVGGQRLLERQLTAFHARHDAFELGKRAFKGRILVGFYWLGHARTPRLRRTGNIAQSAGCGQCGVEENRPQ